MRVHAHMLLTGYESALNFEGIVQPFFRISSVCRGGLPRDKDLVLLRGAVMPVVDKGRMASIAGLILLPDGRVVGHVGGERPQDGLHLEECEVRVFAQDPCDDAGYVGSGEAVARSGDPTSFGPRNPHVYSRSPKLHWRLGIVVEGVGIMALVGGNRDNGGIQRGEARYRHVVGGGDEHGVLEVSPVGQVVERREEVLLGGSHAYVGYVHTVLYCPLDAGCEGGAPSGEARAQDFHAIEFAAGSYGADDAGAGGAVAVGVPVRLGVVQETQRSVGDGNVAAYASPDRRVVGIDP